MHDLAAASDGGLFVLFTSHGDVRAVAELLRAAGAGARWPLLVHGDETRDALLRRFRDVGARDPARHVVVLGGGGRGRATRCARCSSRSSPSACRPSRSPRRTARRSRRAGGDPFREYMLPHAALRLKQGFGRLIRSTTDRGVIVLGDPRVLTKRYGEQLLDALPPARRIVAPWSELRAALERFYQEGRPR